MFVVIFEVQPKPEHWNGYLDLAAFLKPKLEAIDGFIDNDRFKSRQNEGRLLSLSTWQDEKALVRWRSQAAHHGAQQQGRARIFADYHLRIGEVTADNRPPPGIALVEQRFDETAAPAKGVTITETLGDAGIAPSGSGLLSQEIFDSIYTEGKSLLLAAWRDTAAAANWEPQGQAMRHRRVRIIRDYGMTDRAEAPQFHPAMDA
jgi:heme-degrading monooxygenase HmoA